MERKGEDDFVCLDESFFINDDYQLTTFEFGSQVLQLYCLRAASRQLVWPGAVLLNDYLSKNAGMLRGCSVIELGSGVGITGLQAEKLEWGNSDQLNHILEENPRGFDLVLGADICFQQSSVPLLFDTVQQLLLAGKGKCKFMLAYVSRAKVMDAMIVSEAVGHGLVVKEVAGTRTIVKNLEGVIFEITLSQLLGVKDIEVEEH